MDNTVMVVVPQYGTVVTDIGAAKLTEAAFEGRKVNITHAAVGDGGGAYYKPTTDQAGLVNECWRGEIAYAKVSDTTPNMYDIKFIVPADVGGFTIREAAIMDEDGDAIAIWNTPAADKVAITEGVSFPLTMLSHIVFQDAGALKFSVNSALDTVSQDDLDAALERHNADEDAHPDLRALITALSGRAAVSRVSVVIPVDGWTEAEGTEDGYGYICDVAIEGVTADCWPMGGPDKSSADAAREAEFGGCETMDGYLRFYAASAPKTDITATIVLVGEGAVSSGAGGSGSIPVASSSTLGGVKIQADSGLKIDSEGNLAVDTSTDDEAGSALEDVFANQE